MSFGGIATAELQTPCHPVVHILIKIKRKPGISSQKIIQALQLFRPAVYVNPIQNRSAFMSGSIAMRQLRAPYICMVPNEKIFPVGIRRTAKRDIDLIAISSKQHVQFEGTPPPVSGYPWQRGTAALIRSAPNSWAPRARRRPLNRRFTTMMTQKTKNHAPRGNYIPNALARYCLGGDAYVPVSDA